MFSIAIMLVIPTGIRVSDLIEDTYQASIAATIQEAKDATDTIQNSQSENAETEQSGLSGFFSKVTDSITGAAAGAVEKLRNVLNRFLEALAVMLVTTCLIPILVLLLFVWLVKLILGVELPPLGVPRRSGEKIGGERPDIRLQFRQICGMLEKRTAWSGT